MKQKKFLILMCFVFSFKFLSGQTLQPEDPSLLPEKAVNIVKTPSYTPKTDLINLIEQKGLYPYKGHTCEDASISSELGADGKKYGTNEYSKIFLNITQYGQGGKEIFNSTKPYDLTLIQLQDYAASLQREVLSAGVTRNVITKDVRDGKIVIAVDVVDCPEGKYKQYTLVQYKSAALMGTTIINITGSYYSSDNSLAEQIHSETLEKISHGLN